MRIFISYASKDHPVCQRIIDILKEGHMIWYDKRIHVGQKWWSVIVQHILWSDAFIFLVSTNSLNSRHCKKEFEIALREGKKIFPILIEPLAHLPAPLPDYQYIDMSPTADTPEGLTVENAAELHNSMINFERRLWRKTSTSKEQEDPKTTKKAEPFNPENIFFDEPHYDANQLIDDLTIALQEDDFENAIYLIDFALRKGWRWELHNLEEIRTKVVELFHEQQHYAEAEAQYRKIERLASRDNTISLAATAYRTFRQLYPDHPDPSDLMLRLSALTDPIPSLEWCTIPEGYVEITQNNRRYRQWVDSFRISKYPITNMQFDVFVYAEDGYANMKWWEFSKEACSWRMNHPKATIRQPQEHPEYPRVNVSWYEAQAFCNWLGHHLQAQITLPLEQEWQRAAQGDDDRHYPWGKTYDPTRCNGRAAKINRVASVKAFPNGKSPFDVYGMSGNIWEWTLSADERKKVREDQVFSVPHRITKGGSCSSDYRLLRCSSRLLFYPDARFGTLGFRVAMKG